MESREYFETLSLEEIRSFVDNEVEESLYLEFKTVNHPNKEHQQHDYKNLSKCLSGFANSNGGLIVWGIYAKQNDKGNDVAKELRPISELTKLSNKFKKYENQAVTPTIIGVEHKKVFESETDDKGYLVTYIPASTLSPHMANSAGNYYYKRSGDNFYRCEHFDIMDMVTRESRSILHLAPIEFYVTNANRFAGNSQRSYNLEAIFAIRNTGRATAKNIRLELNYGPRFIIMIHGLDGNGIKAMKEIPSATHSKVYHSESHVFIHPDSELEVDKIQYSNFQNEGQITEGFILKYKLQAENSMPVKGEIQITNVELKKVFNNYIMLLSKSKNDYMNG
ncbi:helix-turn-helix domain-containing protein [Lewinella sp. IMCC34191]|uniref:AlbA family DNA-binding domain-containing protein n=1 Tax=Lewinella sp. IMCC34191 TaxID=2259172 RepID=UPI000E2381C9|nr:ATP-binding protein [Lewinella sp. IMCC34191]